MSRKDYIKIAVILKANNATAQMTHDFADMLADDNASFDRERFYAAAGWRN
jgi:hypothetical protein